MTVSSLLSWLAQLEAERILVRVNWSEHRTGR